MHTLTWSFLALLAAATLKSSSAELKLLPLPAFKLFPGGSGTKAHRLSHSCSTVSVRSRVTSVPVQTAQICSGPDGSVLFRSRRISVRTAAFRQVDRLFRSRWVNYVSVQMGYLCVQVQMNVFRSRQVDCVLRFRWGNCVFRSK